MFQKVYGYRLKTTLYQKKKGSSIHPTKILCQVLGQILLFCGSPQSISATEDVNRLLLLLFSCVDYYVPCENLVASIVRMVQVEEMEQRVMDVN